MKDLVLGIDVGSQGTCAQLIDVQGELLAVAYEGYDVRYPRPGWAEQDPARLAGGAQPDGRRGDRRRRPLAHRGALVRRAAGRPGVRGRARRAAARRDHLDGPARRRRVRRDRRARRPRAPLRDERAATSTAGTSARRSPGSASTSPRCSARTARFLLPGSFVALRGLRRYGVDASNASSSMLVDVRTREWHEGICDGFGIDPARLAPIVPPHGVLSTIAPWLREATGLPAEVLVVCGCGDEMAATLGAGVVDPGAVCDVIGHGRADLRRHLRARVRSDPARRAAPPRRPRDVAAREPGLRLRRRVPLVPRPPRPRGARPRRRGARRRLRAAERARRGRRRPAPRVRSGCRA